MVSSSKDGDLHGLCLFHGGVINSNILPKNDSSSRHLSQCPSRLDITLHFTLEVVHELMQQQQTSQWSSKTYLTISNNSKNLKHPPISYLCNSTFQNFNGTNWDVQKELQTREFQWTKYYTQMNLAVLIPLFGQNISQFYFVFSRVKILSIGKNHHYAFALFLLYPQRYSSKWINWNKTQTSGTNTVMFCQEIVQHQSPKGHDTETLQWNNFPTYTTTTRLNKKRNNPGPSSFSVGTLCFNIWI